MSPQPGKQERTNIASEILERALEAAIREDPDFRDRTAAEGFRLGYRAGKRQAFDEKRET